MPLPGKSALCRLTVLLLAGCAASGPEVGPAPSPDIGQAAEPAVEDSRSRTAPIPKKTLPAEPAPAVVQPPVETAAKPKPALVEQPAWLTRLDRLAGKNALRRDAHYFPRLAWLSARWCRKGDDNGPTALVYRVERTPTGFLKLNYADAGGSDKYYNHVQISGDYYDLWDEFGFGSYLRQEGGRRLEKRSDNEFALVYYFEEKPERDRYDSQVFIDYAKRRAAGVGGRDHIADPPVFVKCDRD